MQNRINWIDVVRGIGILLVILGHCQNPLFYLIFYAFHMPLFFFISGYCTSNTRKGYKNYLYLIKEYFVWTIINLLLQLSLEMYKSRALFTEDMLSYIKKSLIGIIYSAPSMDWLPVCTPLWFLPCVFLAKIIFEYVLRHEKAWRLVILLFVLGVFCSYIKVPYFETLPWNINVAFLAQIYMYIGYLYRQNSVLEKLNGIKAFCFGVLGVIGASINGQVNLAGRLFGKSVLFMLLNSVLLITALLYLCKKLRKNIFLEFIGKNSIYYIALNYFVNYTFLPVLKGLLLKVSIPLDTDNIFVLFTTNVMFITCVAYLINIIKSYFNLTLREKKI